MARTLDMFDKPRWPRQWRMVVCDAGDGPCCCDETPISVRYLCPRCDHETGWMGAKTVTEAKRGIPCPKCNAPPNDRVEGRDACGASLSHAGLGTGG